MAIDFLFSSKSQAVFDGVKVIPLDASLEENHVYKALVTKNPVETGADISDNISINPVELSITGFITDTPVKFFQGIRNAVSGSGSLSKTAHDDLVFLFKAKQKMTVITGLTTYKDMVISALSFPRNAQTGRAIRFECQLMQIITVTFETGEIDASTLGNTYESKEQATKTQDLGKQPAKTGSVADKELTSVAYDLVYKK